MIFKDRVQSLIAAGCLLLAAQTASALESGSIQGKVTDAGGSPVAGAFVRIYQPQTRLTFMVVSGDGGRYDATDLPVGTYVVEGIGGNFQSMLSAPVTVGNDRATAVGVSLTVKRGPLLLHAWPDQVPTSQQPKKGDKITLAEGPGEDLVQTRCSTCHSLGRVVGSRLNLGQWQGIVGEMQGNMVSAHFPPNLSLTDPQAATVAAYLAKSYGPVSFDVNARLPYHLMQGQERNYRAVTFLITPKGAQPHNFSMAPDGVAWAAARGAVGSPHGFLVRFDPHTLQVTNWYAPAGTGTISLNAGHGRRLGNPQIDSHGVLWTTDAPNQRWLSFDTRTQKWTAYPVPAGRPAQSNWLTFAPNGVIWATDEVNGIYSLDPKTREWHFYKSHFQKSGSYGIAVASDGTVWFAEDGIDRMGHVYPDTGKEEDLPIPLKGVGKLYPRRLAADGHDNVWVGLWQAGKLMKIDSKTKKMTFYTPPTKVPGCYAVSIDFKHDFIWFGEQQADKIARFDPKTNSWLEFPLPYAQSDDRTIQMDPTDPNRVFFSGDTSDLFGFIEYKPH